ncbi:MAG: hydroxyacylglutathione hydrolase [Hydrogenophaga sp.]|jgi:hydroxyacylglutathione hydrolase|nr:hydroxyacylglutathione hydrolase [Hydrogenophaga sp.]
MELIPLPAFSDNYIWLLHHKRRVLVVDPGEAAGVLGWLDQHGAVLDTILITHHHPDHTGGVAALRESTGARVVGPRNERMPEPLQRVGDGDQIEALGLRFEVLEVPGHTAGHIAYYCADLDDLPAVFCGDTLFSGGCGRLFEGTPGQMLASLNRLASLPGPTRVCCTHEYTLSNLKFALAVEPGNEALVQYNTECVRLRAQNFPTLPSSIARERQINPFLRSGQPPVIASAQSQMAEPSTDPEAVFAALREWKNRF